jgi:salicylate hydroxylase
LRHCLSSPRLTSHCLGTGEGDQGCTFLDHFHQRADAISLTLNVYQVGAGIQIPPNASRVLASLDILHLVEQEANDVKHLKLRRYNDGEILANRPVGRNGIPWL